jgi:hypothetical protein
MFRPNLTIFGVNTCFQGDCCSFFLVPFCHARNKRDERAQKTEKKSGSISMKFEVKRTTYGSHDQQTIVTAIDI